jgi:hypothetical protein
MAKPETPRKPAKKAAKAKTPRVEGETSSAQENPPQAAKPKIGRPSKYTPQIAKEIVERLSQGIPLWEICRDDHMPAWRTIYDWMERDAELSAWIARARELGQDAIAEDCLRIIDEEPTKVISEGGIRYDSAFVQWQKNRVEQRLKLLAKWNPKRYGDRVQLAGDAEQPIKIQAETQAEAMFEALLKNIELKRQANGSR